MNQQIDADGEIEARDPLPSRPSAIVEAKGGLVRRTYTLLVSVPLPIQMMGSAYVAWRRAEKARALAPGADPAAISAGSPRSPKELASSAAPRP